MKEPKALAYFKDTQAVQYIFNLLDATGWRHHMLHFLGLWHMCQLQKDVPFTAEQNVSIYYNF